MKSAAELQVRDLRLQYAGQSAPLLSIDELDLSAGTSLGICGASGAGKTSLLHCLAAIARPSAGRVCWGQTDLTALSADAADHWRHRHLGLIFQDFHLMEGLNALDNVLLPATFDRWTLTPELRERARDLLAQVGMPSMQRQVQLLSRGERQRVAFARALLLRPSIVLADEPTASLDPRHRDQLSDVLLALVRAHGASLIVVLHEETLLARMDRTLMLQHGRLCARGLAV